jgi:hypothetical protein
MTFTPSPRAHLDVRFDTLHALRVKGFATVDAVAGTISASPPDVEIAVGALDEDGLASYRDGRICGWRLTADGKAVHAAELMDRTSEGERRSVFDLHEAFVPLNACFKQLCTTWQMRDGAPNDHGDGAYDEMVISALGALHGELDRVLVNGGFVRSPWYVPRLSAAMRRLRAGEADAFARPLSGSYHDVWMELHQDLILTLGLERTASDT